MSFLDARARFEDDFFAGLTEAVREAYTSFNDQLNQLNKAEREAGRAETTYLSLAQPVRKVVEPVKAKPVGFSNKEDKLSKVAMVSRFGYLLNLEPVDRVREAVKIHLENPGLNHSHLSRSLGQHSSWFGQLMYRARNKGML